jgi:hypothetical protein
LRFAPEKFSFPLRMKRPRDGAGLAQIQLYHGHHPCRFLADGKAMLDPRAQGIARDYPGEH